MLVMESFGSDHLPKLDFFSDFRALCNDVYFQNQRLLWHVMWGIPISHKNKIICKTLHSGPENLKKSGRPKNS